MESTKTIQTESFNDMYTDEVAVNQQKEMEQMENQTTVTANSTNIGFNEIAAGMLGKTVDTAVAVSQFAVGVTIGVGQITLGSVNKWFMEGTESVNRQFNDTVNRIFGVKG